MKGITHIILLLAIGVGIGSCSKKEEALTPSNADVTYQVPQGNAAYDQTITGYYNTYGSYLLYKFSDRDAYWTPTMWKKPVQSSTGNWSVGADVVPAIADYIAPQLDLIDKSLFSLYPASFLKQFLPVKLLLCSKVDSIYTTYVFTPVYTPAKGVKKIAAYYSYDNIAINYGDASVNQMTAAEKLAFLARLNQVLFQSINDRGLIKPTIEFTNSADYSTTPTTQAAAYGKGIISTYYSATALSDWNAFVMAMVTLSETDLNRSVANTNSSAVGILNTTKDANGLIRKRYNIVRNYYINTYQVDLQKIGNKARGM